MIIYILLCVLILLTKYTMTMKKKRLKFIILIKSITIEQLEPILN